MRGGNNLKRAIMTGLIAGFGSGLVDFIFYNSGLFELFSVLPAILPMSTQNLAIYCIIQGVIWGNIFTVFYAIIYDYVPSTGIKKGLVYGFIIWIIVGLRIAIIQIVHLYHQFAIPSVITAFFSLCITYGLLIGYLYKK